MVTLKKYETQNLLELYLGIIHYAVNHNFPVNKNKLKYVRPVA